MGRYFFVPAERAVDAVGGMGAGDELSPMVGVDRTPAVPRPGRSGSETSIGEAVGRRGRGIQRIRCGVLGRPAGLNLQ